jgi:hypothetical protein
MFVPPSTHTLQSHPIPYTPSNPSIPQNTPNNPQEVFDNDHRVVSQKGSSAGRFTFSAADSGDHKICFTPSSSSGGSGWLSALHPMGGIKLTLDLAIGETSAIESKDKGKMNDIVQKVKDLNGRLQDIRREQVFQRVSYGFVYRGLGLGGEGEAVGLRMEWTCLGVWDRC